MTWRVVPDGAQWKVTRWGSTRSHHRKKRRALKYVYRNGSMGDELVIHDRRGRILDQRTLRG